MHQRENAVSMQDGPVEAALAEYFTRLDRGESVDLAEIIAAHPGCEAGVHQFLNQERKLQMAVVETPPAAAPPENHAGRELGDFRILRVLGQGGMGVVYEAEQVSLGRRVAFKVLPSAVMLGKQQLARFKNEARAAATLDHPNIVAVYSVGSEGGVHYYAMQLIEGPNLAQVISTLRRAQFPSEPAAANSLQDGALSTDAAQLTTDVIPSAIPGAPALQPADMVAVQPVVALPDFQSREFYLAVARLGIQAAEALDHAHQNGILHRDIKPGNLMLDAGGKLYVTDFGLARIEADAGLTMTGDIIGTLRYMAPEQALAKRAVVDHRGDIYSLGATLYELLTLRPAFTGEDRQELLRQIAFEEPTKPRRIDARIPDDLETIVLKAMEKEPGDRYTTAGELAADLKRFLDDRPIVARRASLGNRARKWATRHVGLLAAVALIMLLAAIGAGVSAMLIAHERTVAQQSAAQSDKNLSLALQALDGALSGLFVGDLSDSTFQMTNNERELLGRGVRFYEELAEQNGVDPATWPTYLTLLTSSTLENAYELGEAGRNDEADKAYRMAVAKADRMQANFEPDSQRQMVARDLLVGCHNDYATFLLKRGDLKAAATHLLDARKILEGHRRQMPNETKYASSLGTNHYNMGKICTEAGLNDDAEASYSHALPLLELAVRSKPNDVVCRQMLAMGLYNLGLLHGSADHSEEAGILWQKSLVEWQRLASDDPLVSEYHCRVGATLNNLGVLAMERGDLAEARKLFEQALVYQKRAVARQPVYELVHQFMGHHYRGLIEVLDQLGDAEALDAIKKEQKEWQSSSSLNSNRVK